MSNDEQKMSDLIDHGLWTKEQYEIEINSLIQKNKELQSNLEETEDYFYKAIDGFKKEYPEKKDCECSHVVPTEFAFSGDDGWTCYECHIEFLNEENKELIEEKNKYLEWIKDFIEFIGNNDVKKLIELKEIILKDYLKSIDESLKQKS